MKPEKIILKSRSAGISTWAAGLSSLRDGESCGHPCCLSHVTHPCEVCGRVGGHVPGMSGEPINKEPWVGSNRDIDPFNEEDVRAWQERDRQAARILKPYKPNSRKILDELARAEFEDGIY